MKQEFKAITSEAHTSVKKPDGTWEYNYRRAHLALIQSFGEQLIKLTDDGYVIDSTCMSMTHVPVTEGVQINSSVRTVLHGVLQVVCHKKTNILKLS